MEPIICDWNSFYQIFENFDLQQRSKNVKKRCDYWFQRLNFSVRSRFIGRRRLLDMTRPFNWDLGQTVFYQHFISSQSSAEYQAKRSGFGFGSHAGTDEEQAHQSQGSDQIRLNQVLFPKVWWAVTTEQTCIWNDHKQTDDSTEHCSRVINPWQDGLLIKHGKFFTKRCHVTRENKEKEPWCCHRGR